MRKTIKKALALTLSLCMVMPGAVFAEDVIFENEQVISENQTVDEIAFGDVGTEDGFVAESGDSEFEEDGFVFGEESGSDEPGFVITEENSIIEDFVIENEEIAAEDSFSATTTDVIVSLGAYVDEVAITKRVSGRYYTVYVSRPSGYSSSQNYSTTVSIEIGATISVNATGDYGYTAYVSPTSGTVGTNVTSIIATADYTGEKPNYFYLLLTRGTGGAEEPTCAQGYTFSKSTYVTCVAGAPADGYAFAGWSNGTSIVSTNPTYSFYIYDTTSLTATYNKVITITAADDTVKSGTQYIPSTSKVTISGLKYGDKQSDILNTTALRVSLPSTYSKSAGVGSKFTLTPSGAYLKSGAKGYEIVYIAGTLTVKGSDAADAFVAAVNRIPAKPGLNDRTTVDAATALYAKLGAGEKAMDAVVAAKKTLDAAEAAVTAAESKKKEDQAAADRVTSLINLIPSPVTTTSKSTIDAARTAYNTLTADQKALIPTASLEKLRNAENAYEQAVADVAINAIKKIPSVVDVTDKETIEAARKAYDSLTAVQKALVPKDSLDKLEKAEKDYATAVADQKAADAVVEMIDAIPGKVTLSDAAQVERVRDAYEDLRASQRARVPDASLQKLTGAEETIMELEEEKEEADQEAADKFATAVNAVKGNKAGEGKTLVAAATAIFNGLSSDQKNLVDEKTMTRYKEELSAFTENRIFKAGSAWYKVLEDGNVTFQRPDDIDLETVIIPNQVKKNGFFFKVVKVSGNAFNGCRSLKWAIISKNIQELGESAFTGTISLTRIRVRGTAVSEVTDAFEKAGRDGKLVVRVPSSMVDEYSELFVEEGKLNGKVVAA